jgi:hypothetical protein
MTRQRRAAWVRQDQAFKGRQFTAEVILWAVRWYLMFPISYRDLELMLLDRGVEVDHTTIFRCTRQRCQVAFRTRTRAAFSPSWASEITSLTSRKPRRASVRRKSVQKVSASEQPTAMVTVTETIPPP